MNKRWCFFWFFANLPFLTLSQEKCTGLWKSSTTIKMDQGLGCGGFGCVQLVDELLADTKTANKAEGAFDKQLETFSQGLFDDRRDNVTLESSSVSISGDITSVEKINNLPVPRAQLQKRLREKRQALRALGSSARRKYGVNFPNKSNMKNSSCICCASHAVIKPGTGRGNPTNSNARSRSDSGFQNDDILPEWLHAAATDEEIIASLHAFREHLIKKASEKAEKRISENNLLALSKRKIYAENEMTSESVALTPGKETFYSTNENKQSRENTQASDSVYAVASNIDEMNHQQSSTTRDLEYARHTKTVKNFLAAREETRDDFMKSFSSLSKQTNPFMTKLRSKNRKNDALSAMQVAVAENNTIMSG